MKNFNREMKSLKKNLMDILFFFFIIKSDLSLFLPKSYHFFFLINSYFIYLFIYFLAVLGLCFVWGLSLVAASGGHSSSWCGGHSSSRCAGHSSSWCTGLSLSRPLLSRSIGSRRAGSVVVAHGPSCSVACGIFPDQVSNPCPLH